MRSQGIYRKIYTKMWGDEKFMKLSSPQPNAQTLWLYLLTGPHNTVLPGIFILGEMSLAEFLNWDIEPTKIILTELANEGMLEVDSKTKVVILPTAVQYNPPESPQTPTAWARQFASIPECSLKCKFLKYLVIYMSTKADIKNIFLAEFQDWLTEEQKAILINGGNKSDPKITAYPTDENFFNSLRKLYPHINIEQELNQMKAWFMTPRGRGRKLTRRFIINWLNKTDKPIEIARTLNHYKDLS